MKQAIISGWAESEIRRVQYEKQKDIEEGKVTVIGVNKFRKPFEEEIIQPAHEVSREMVDKHLANLKRFKQNRNRKTVSEGLENLYNLAKNPDFNLVEPAIEASESLATMAEMRGVIRMAYGETFDPFDMVEPEFDASFATK